jgi:choline dehydrogenase-like flavoprotein
VGSVGYIKQMTDTAASLGIAPPLPPTGLPARPHRVLVAPPVCRSELLEICQEADVGLALFPSPTGPMDSSGARPWRIRPTTVGCSRRRWRMAKRYAWDQHHMGTTRMQRDLSIGVVDENCRVHGVANLYVPGCSVFPTGGMFNPTLTVVAPPHWSTR